MKKNINSEVVFQEYLRGDSIQDLSIKYNCTIQAIYYHIRKNKLFGKILSENKHPRPLNWHCKCGYGDHEYFITCPRCGKENHLLGNNLPK